MMVVADAERRQPVTRAKITLTLMRMEVMEVCVCVSVLNTSMGNVRVMPNDRTHIELKLNAVQKTCEA